MTTDEPTYTAEEVRRRLAWTEGAEVCLGRIIREFGELDDRLARTGHPESTAPQFAIQAIADLLDKLDNCATAR